MIQKLTLLIIIIFLFSCAGTIKTTKHVNKYNLTFQKAYIISSDNSKYIEFKFGTITPYGYITPIDDQAEKSNIIGNTDTIIKQELEKHGIYSVIGKRGDKPEGFDLIVEYTDTWRWDFRKILDRLEINFISPTGDSIIAKSTFNIYKNKELHNFPTPEKEVPKMINQLLVK